MKKLIFAVLLVSTTVGCKSLKNDFLDPAKNNPNSTENKPVNNNPILTAMAGSSTGPSTHTMSTIFPPVNVSFYYSQDFGQPNFHCYPLGGTDTKLPTQNPANGQPWASYTTTNNSVTVTFQGMAASQAYCWELKADPNIDAAASHELY